MKLLLAIFLVSACGQFDGSDGINGTACSTRNSPTGIFVECSDGTSNFIKFPADGDSVIGPQGEDGQDAVSCVLVEKNVTCHNHTRKADQYLKCVNGEVFLKQTKLVSGC
jgi:hypothetical protein